jgi:hypothetical protein
MPVRITRIIRKHLAVHVHSAVIKVGLSVIILRSGWDHYAVRNDRNVNFDRLARTPTLAFARVLIKLSSIVIEASRIVSNHTEICGCNSAWKLEVEEVPVRSYMPSYGLCGLFVLFN